MSDLQPTVLKALLVKETWETMGKTVTEDVINDVSYKRLLKCITNLHAQTEHDVDIHTVLFDIEGTYTQDVVLLDDLMERYRLMDEAPLLPTDQIEAVVRKFISKEKLTKAVNWGISHLNDDEVCLEEFVDLAIDARDTSLSVDTEVADFANYAAPDSSVRKGIIPLSCNSRLSNKLGGGTAGGELFVWMGAGGRGKTSHMAQMAVDTAKLGGNALVVSCEINEAKYMLMFDRYICKMKKEEILAQPLVALQRRAKALVGNVWVKDWSHAKVTVSDIEALLDSMIRQGKRIDMLVVDYWTILVPRGKHKHERDGYMEIGLDLRRLANKYGIPVITGWQANRSGAMADTLTEEHIGEDYRIMWTADTIVTLNQNPEENNNKRMRYGILKMREGTDRSEYQSYCDLERMIMRDEEAGDLAAKFNLEVTNAGDTEGISEED